MPRSPPTASGNAVAIHAAALVPTANGAGEIILFGGDNHNIGSDESKAAGEPP